MQKYTHQRRQSPAINIGSMADIAFLLLIFFLVTITISSDQGILVRLPPYSDCVSTSNVLSRNVFTVLLNSNNDLLVEGDGEIPIDLLKEKIKTFILNPKNDPHMATKPQAAIISLVHDRGTSYEAYLSTYNEIRAAYNELWEDIALKDYRISYTALDRQSRKKIHQQIPLIISEVEPACNVFMRGEEYVQAQ